MTVSAPCAAVDGWLCHRCQQPVEVQKVRLEYRKTIFAMSMPACAGCGKILVDEELALGKMCEAEQALEDK